MNYNFNIETIDRLSTILNYNVSNFLDLYFNFVKIYQPKIIAYYSDDDGFYDINSFTFLTDLMTMNKKLSELVRIQKNSIRRIDEWELCEFIDDIQINLESVYNANKYFRTDRLKSVKSGVNNEFTLQKHKTLEDVVGNDWINVSIKNDLREKDYTSSGGSVVDIDQSVQNTEPLFLNSVVGPLKGTLLYGSDLNRKITFSNQDLDVLGNLQTFIQTCDIHIDLRRGDIPEFKEIGLDLSYIIGVDVGTLSYASIMRQIEQVFSNDDTIKELRLTNVLFDNDLSLEFEIKSFYDVTYKNTMQVI